MVKSVLLRIGPLTGGVDNPRGIVYVVRNTVKNAKMIAEQMRMQAQLIATECPVRRPCRPSRLMPFCC